MNETITNRPYQREADFERVGQFLIDHYLPNNQDGNWLQPTWEYMHSHPNLDAEKLGRCQVWESNGEVVGVVHYESSPGEAFFEIHPEFTRLKRAMLDHAEQNLAVVNDQGELVLNAFVNDFDQEMEALVKERGYQLKPDWKRPMYTFPIPEPFPAIPLREGFMLKSLADDNDLHKMHRVLWRGFNNPGEPPEEGIIWREQMQSGPNFRHDLTMVVEAPDGNFASFSGIWHEKTNHIVYVEPVATDPAYRRMGLGKAAVLEGIRRGGMEGATVAYVGSDQLFYQALGFRKVFVSNCWQKKLST